MYAKLTCTQVLCMISNLVSMSCKENCFKRFCTDIAMRFDGHPLSLLSNSILFVSNQTVLYIFLAVVSFNLSDILWVCVWDCLYFIGRAPNDAQFARL